MSRCIPASEHDGQSGPQLGTKRRRGCVPRFRGIYDRCKSLDINQDRPWASVRGSVRLCVSRSLAMDQRNCRVAVRKVLDGASLVFLIVAGVSLCTAMAAYAQAADGSGGPTMAYVPTGNGSSDSNLDVPAPDGNLDIPAPAADYDVPTDAGSVADADSDSESEIVAGTGSVLELPQVVDPASDAISALANANPVPTDSNATLASAEAALTDSNAPRSGDEDGGQPGSVGDNAVADEPSGGSMSEAQDYQDEADSGPVVVYAAPVYVGPTPRYLAPMRGAASPTLRAGAYDQRPITDVLRPHAGGLGRYQVGTGTRLFNSRLGQGGFCAGSRPGRAALAFQGLRLRGQRR
jgi:hypothetical protein